MVYSASERLSEPLREPDPRRGARAAARRRPDRACCGSERRACSAARATATSCSTTRTSRATTPRSARPAARGSSRDLGSTNGVKVNGRRDPGRRSRSSPATRSSSAPHASTSSWSSAMDARPRRRRAEVRLPRRALPVPALGGALGAEGPAPQRGATAATPAARGLRGRHRACTSPPRGLGGDGDRRRARSCGWRPRRGCAPAPPTISSDGAAARPRRPGGHPARGHVRLVAARAARRRRGTSWCWRIWARRTART